MNNIVNQIKSILINEKDIIFALIFGSFSDGTYSKFSDIDIGVYLKNNDYDLLETGGLIYKIENSIDRKVDLIKLNNLFINNPKMAYNVIENSKVLFNRNKEIYNMFKEKTIRYYLDTKYLYKLKDKYFDRRIKGGDFGKRIKKR